MGALQADIERLEGRFDLRSRGLADMRRFKREILLDTLGATCAAMKRCGTDTSRECYAEEEDERFECGNLELLECCGCGAHASTPLSRSAASNAVLAPLMLVLAEVDCSDMTHTGLLAK